MAMHAHQKKAGPASVTTSVKDPVKDRLDRSRLSEGILASQLRFDLLWLRSGARGCDWLVVVASKS